jgi:hypothetical protein
LGILATSFVTSRPFRAREQRFTFPQRTQLVTKAIHIIDLPIKPEVHANAAMDSLVRVQPFVSFEYPA